MSSEKFTQGEWRVDEYTNAIYVLENGQYKTVANTNCTNWDGDVWGANAALIAAALLIVGFFLFMNGKVTSGDYEKYYQEMYKGW